MNCTIRDQGNMIVFENGRGFGHGVGLCQWGAEGKAQRGLNYAQILAEYYPGSKLCKMGY
jgi:stage II sporulation protein D